MASEERERRRFSLLDGMILIAAVGVGLAGTRWRIAGRAVPLWWGVDLLEAATWPCLGLTLAALIVRLRRPRPTWKRLTCQPGFVGCVAVAIALGITLLLRLLVMAMFSIRSRSIVVRAIAMDREFGIVSSDLQQNAIVAVATAWLLLVLGRRWRAERSGVDRLGRVLGAFWLCHPFLYLVVAAIQTFLPSWMTAPWWFF